MKRYIIEEQVPAMVTYTYEIIAEDEETAMEMIMNREADSCETTTETIYESSITIEFTRQVIGEEEI
jgi:hypothetical protein